MKRQLCLGLGILFVAACQPKAADVKKAAPSSDYHPMQDEEDDDGDDGAYGDNDQSTQNFEVILLSPEPESAMIAAAEPVDEVKQKVAQIESSPEVPDDAANSSIVEGSPETDPRLEAVEAVRIISENAEVLPAND